ncbi:MAG: Calx-beta domain-containing protein [Micromonosporaceae bacterium]
MAGSVFRRALRIFSGAALVAVTVIAPAAPSYSAPNGPQVSIGDVAVVEGDSGTSNAVFEVTLSKASGKVSTVDFETSDGTASAGLDYQASSGTVTFNKRQTSKTVSVPIIGDTIDEPDETFTVTLSRASRDLVIGDGTGEATIAADDEATPPPAAADLAVQLTDSPDPVGLGTELTYHAHVVNNGPDAATDVQLTDVLKPYVEFVSASPGCVNDAGTVRCSTATLASGVAYDVDITVRVQTTGAISNTVSVASGTGDPDSGNNSDTEATQVSPEADLRVSLTHEPEPVLHGGSVTFALGLANDGPSPAASSRAHLTLPDGLDFTSADPACGYDAGSRTVTCSAGTLAAGGSVSYAVTATASSVGAKTVTATAETSTPDSDPANNQATDTVNAVGPQADLALTVSGDPDTVLTGEPVAYTWTITNNGPQSAESVILDTFIAEGGTLNSFGEGSVGCIYTFADRHLRCNFGDLASGASHTVTVNFTYSTAGTKTFPTTATSDTDDPVAGNNTASVTTTVNTPQADLGLTVVGNPGTVLTGEPVAYTWTITNNGPQSAESVILDTFIAEGGTLNSFGEGSVGCIYTFADRHLRCNFGDLASGASHTVTVNFTYSTAGTKTFPTTATSDTDDPAAGNNTASVTTTVTAV